MLEKVLSLGPIVCIHMHAFFFTFLTYINAQKNSTVIAKKLCSSSHDEIQLKLFTDEAAPNSTRKTQQTKSIHIASYSRR